MSDHLDRAAEVIAPIIADATACGYDFEGACDTCRADSALIVKALDAAGLLVSPERDTAVAAKALREAADDMDDTDDPDAIHVYNGDIDKWLRARADRIEREAGESDADA